MHHLKALIARFALPLGLGAALVVIGGISSAFADSTTATTTITGGTLTEAVSTTPTVTATLNGTDQTPTYSLDIAGDDNTGSGTGWNLTVTSTQFTTGAPLHTLSATASSLTGVTSVCAQGTCTDPTNATTYPVTVPAGATPPAGVKFFDAAANTGMGDFTITPSIGITIPANTYAGIYTSTVTLSIVSGP